MRRLIVCADGTWNRPDEKDDGTDAPTNVVKLARAIRPVDPNGVTQITYYHPGVGTHNESDKVFGGAFGSGLDANIANCYRFLTHNYAPGDELYFFGFSRGAYTVRSLAGLIRNSGLIKSRHGDQEDEAFGMYRSRDPHSHPNSAEAVAFRGAYAYDPVPITCIGVWDTVGALGLPIEFFEHFTRDRYQFHDVTLSSRVRNAFHALAIDERRKPFVPTLWEQPLSDRGKNWLEQAWFPGVHGNVGGGYADSSLSDVTFRWMISRVSRRCGVYFDDEVLETISRPSPLGRLYDSLSLAYRLLGGIERRIDERAATNTARGVATWEYVHESARERIASTSRGETPYQPVNLTTYLGRTDPKPLVLADLEALFGSASGDVVVTGAGE